MAETSGLARIVTEVIATGPAVLLKERGYRKAGTSFYQPAHVVRIINFQRSQWNDTGEHQFTINVSFFCQRFHTLWTGNAAPKNPCTVMPALTQRIGRLMPHRLDHWWSVTAQTIPTELAAVVTAATRDYALPWLERFATTQELAHFVLSRTRAESGAANDPKLVAAGLLASTGDKERALELIATAKAEHEVSSKQRSWLPHIERFAQRIEHDL